MASERERYVRAIAMLAFACKTLSYRGIYGNWTCKFRVSWGTNENFGWYLHWLSCVLIDPPLILHRKFGSTLGTCEMDICRLPWNPGALNMWVSCFMGHQTQLHAVGSSFSPAVGAWALFTALHTQAARVCTGVNSAGGLIVKGRLLSTVRIVSSRRVWNEHVAKRCLALLCKAHIVHIPAAQMVASHVYICNESHVIDICIFQQISG